MTFKKVMKRIAFISVVLFVAGSIMAAATYALGAATFYTINEHGQVVPSTGGSWPSFNLSDNSFGLITGDSAPPTLAPPEPSAPPASPEPSAPQTPALQASPATQTPALPTAPKGN